MNQVRDLRLSADEMHLLAELLKGDRTRLLEEIHHTDAREFRVFLKQREQMLEGVLSRMEA
ncbi:MAG: hypothetical protein ACM3ZE_23210 [Myxococcales bacterium]